MSTEPDRGQETVDVPKGVTFTVAHRRLKAKGPLGTVERPFPSDALDLASDAGK